MKGVHGRRIFAREVEAIVLRREREQKQNGNSGEYVQFNRLLPPTDEWRQENAKAQRLLLALMETKEVRERWW